MRVRSLFVFLSALLCLLSGCASFSEDSSASYGNYKAHGSSKAERDLALRKEDRLMVCWPIEHYLEERALELSVKEAFKTRGLECIALTDIWPEGFGGDVDRKALRDAMVDAEPDYLLDVTLIDSQEFSAGGGLARRSFEIAVVNFWTGRQMARLDLEVEALGNTYNSYNETLVPLSRCLALTLASELYLYYER